MLLGLDKKGVWRIIGLMSGTSHDGVDTALVEIKEQAPHRLVRGQGHLNIKLIKHLHVPYGKSLRDEISKAFRGDAEHICKLNFKLGEIFAKAVLSLLAESGVKPRDIDAIASHGQTIYHIPPSGGKTGSTLQIGEVAVITERTGILTISDFRARDISAGGHGAPLVPMADYLLFKKKGYIRAILNIGGIANVTIVTGNINDTIAFDIGPGNSLIDEAVRLYSGGRRSSDKDGRIARSGRPDKKLLQELLSHPYFRKRPPKSTGRETFGEEMVKNIFRRYRNFIPQDILSTLTHLTALSIFNAIIPFRPDEVVITGGGVKNRFLMSLIKAIFDKEGIQVNDVSKYAIPSEAKEALSFAILGYLTLRLKHGNLPSATGAKGRVILGKITLP